MSSADALKSPPLVRWNERPAALIAAGVVLAALAAAYAPNLADLEQRWARETNYSHGFLVAPIALAILWQRRNDLDLARLRPSWIGWLALAGALLTRAWFYERNELWLESLTIVPAVAALALAFGGWRFLRWAAPAIGFLIFMFPLPPSVNMILAGPLQRLATIGSTTLLQAMGLPVLAEGNVIYIGSEKLEVAQACNGLSMLASFVTLIVAATILMAHARPMLERIILLLSMIPIALVSNILRITITAWAYHLLGPERSKDLAHDTMGWAMMLIGLALVWVELKILSWLIVEDEDDQKPKLIIPTTTPPRMPPKPKKPA